MFRLRVFHSPNFTGRETHPRVRPKPDRLLTHLPATARHRRIRIDLLKQLAEAIKIHIRQLLP